MTTQQLEMIARQIRRDIMKMITQSNSGHPGGSLGMTDIFTALYFKAMKHNPKTFPSTENTDLFFLSNGHIAPVWYATLARSGYFPLSELGTLRKIHSRLQGHPATKEGLPGIRIASGSLGQGLSVAVGAALAFKMDNRDNWVYCLMGDGECNEGQVWEAAMNGPHQKVDNLIVFLDRNRLQIDGSTEIVKKLDPFPEKWMSFGWNVIEIDGHNFNDILAAIDKAKANKGKGVPTAIIANTIMSKGVPFMENQAKWHGTPPTKQMEADALNLLGKTEYGDFDEAGAKTVDITF